MATTTDIIPDKDADFDTLQAILVAAVALNLVAWNIPAAELAKLTAKQSIWAAAWLIAKDKKNSTVAQKEAKTLARKNYEKVLRPFIQKWIYRNEDMDDAAIEICGLDPRDHTPTSAVKPGKPMGITIRRGTDLQLITNCPKIAGVDTYECILVQGYPLPSWIYISSEGKLVAGPNPNQLPGPNPGLDPQPVSFQIDFTEQREKVFSNLVHDAVYYAYYYVVNKAGVSPLSDPVSIVCW